MLCGPEGIMLSAGRRLCYGPEGVIIWTEGSAWVGPEGLPSRDGSPLRHMDRKVGPGKAYVRKVYWGTH